MNIRTLLAELYQFDSTTPIRVSNGTYLTKDYGCDRGDYSKLYLEHTDGCTSEVIETVENLREMLHQALKSGRMYGYKGGEYPIDLETNVTVSKYGVAGLEVLKVTSRRTIDRKQIVYLVIGQTETELAWAPEFRRHSVLNPSALKDRLRSKLKTMQLRGFETGLVSLTESEILYLIEQIPEPKPLQTQIKYSLKERILNYLNWENRPLTSPEIAEAVGELNQLVSFQLNLLHQEGQIQAWMNPELGKIVFSIQGKTTELEETQSTEKPWFE